MLPSKVVSQLSEVAGLNYSKNLGNQSLFRALLNHSNRTYTLNECSNRVSLTLVNPGRIVSGTPYINNNITVKKGKLGFNFNLAQPVM